MLKARKLIGVLIAACCSVSIAQAQCPGYNAPPGQNINLACAIATTAPSQSTAPALSTTVGATMATQLSQLPIATAVSGAGLVFDASIGGFRVAEDVGPILTQRGDTIGRHGKFLSFTYQRFAFDSIDGIDLKHLQIVNPLGNLYAANDMRVDFRIDQFVALGTYGITDKIDVSILVPFSFVTLKSQRRPGNAATGSGSILYTDFGTGTPSRSALSTNYFPGSASGIGDVTAGIKATVFKSKSEKTSIALGGLVRFPTGDAVNYLGSGAYGVRPYLVASHRMNRVTPNVTLAYQWNGISALNIQNGLAAHLPSSFLYSGGADVKVIKKLSLSGEFIGQAVFSGPRLRPTNLHLTGQSISSTEQFIGSYAMNNASFGFKANPFKGLFISGSVLIKLDDPGLRANYVPFAGIAYRF